MSKVAPKTAAADKAPPPRIGLPILPPRAAWIELIVLFGLIIGIDRLLPALDAGSIQPHPFWLPVLVLSLQYGTISGLLAACSAIGLMAAIYGFPEQDIGENLFVYLSRAWSQPVLWVGAAVVLGQFRMRQIEAKQDLAAAVEQLTSQRNSLARYSDGLRERCDALERREAGRALPDALNALATLGTIAGTSEGGLSDDLSRGLAVVFPGAGARIRLAEGGVVVDATSCGPQPASSGGPSTAQRLERLDRTVIEQRRSVSVLEADGDAALAGIGLVAVPIPGPDGPIGALVLTHLAPHQFGDATTPITQLLATALAPSAIRHGGHRDGQTSYQQPVTEAPQQSLVARFARTNWRMAQTPVAGVDPLRPTGRSRLKA